MFRLLPPCTLLFASALILACDEQSAPSDPAALALPSFRTEQNPDGPGAFSIIVPEASFATTDGELTILAGATFAEHLHFCETGEPPFPVRRHLVFRPDGSVMTTVHGQQLPLIVWQTGVDGPDLLAAMCTEEFLALPRLEGTATFSSHDNDASTTGNRANAGGFRINGHVSSESGDRFLFSGTFHILILKTGETHRFVFDLELKPIGQ